MDHGAVSSLRRDKESTSWKDFFKPFFNRSLYFDSGLNELQGVQFTIAQLVKEMAWCQTVASPLPEENDLEFTDTYGRYPSFS